MQAARPTKMDVSALRFNWQHDSTEPGSSKRHHYPTPTPAVWDSRVNIALKAFFVLHWPHVVSAGLVDHLEHLEHWSKELEDYTQLSNLLLHLLYHCIAGMQAAMAVDATGALYRLPLLAVEHHNIQHPSKINMLCFDVFRFARSQVAFMSQSVTHSDDTVSCD